MTTPKKRFRVIDNLGNDISDMVVIFFDRGGFVVFDLFDHNITDKVQITEIYI